MILDNQKDNTLKVHEWISKYTSNGTMSIVSGYFTVGALAFISKEIDEKISELKLVLGEMVDWSGEREDSLDLLNENLDIEGALSLSKIAKEAVDFLELDKVTIKTLEPNFCHAKVFVFRSGQNETKDNYYITGSSNLTEAGLGLKKSSNIELNQASFGSEANYQEYTEWFDNIWKSEQAHKKKTFTNIDGEKVTKNFKEYIIDQIKMLFEIYTPQEIYHKILFELYGSNIKFEENDAEFNRKIGRLEHTEIYQKLYGFQQKAVKSLIRIIDTYGGAILADAVGLGKTWTALAILKHYEIEGYKTILLCPKKLEQNWQKFFQKDNLFYKDRFEYAVRYHSDLQDLRWDNLRYIGKDKFDLKQVTDLKPKLIVIDESHNLRNHKSGRYQLLVDDILKKTKGRVKVLLLSATPINNSLNDVRNQFKLLVRGSSFGFRDSDLAINNLDFVFKRAQREMNEWRDNGAGNIRGLINNLPDEFIRLTRETLVARNRKWVTGIEKGLTFPERSKPENIYVTPKEIGNFESFEELFNSFPDRMSAYLPSYYIETKIVKSAIDDERQREHFLVKMMQILMTKRLESSWKSLSITTKKILNQHELILKNVNEYLKNKKDFTIEIDDEFVDLDDNPEFEKYTIGKKKKVTIKDIDKAGRIEDYKHDLKEDIQKMNNLLLNLDKFEKKISLELNVPSNSKSCDTKLETLIARIRQKQSIGENPKVLIFSVYSDTVEYLYQQLIARGFSKVAMVTGSISKADGKDIEHKYFEPILERFAPYTKLFNEKNWEDFNTTEKGNDAYLEWLEWLKNNHTDEFQKIQYPIDILIATDTLSEGQNLQDCDLVVNYDIHWNPVRVIQRMGRIDRLGSPNKKIYGINFWPTKNINAYLNLKDRIEQRMAAMQLAGSEVDIEFSDEFKEMAKDEQLEKDQEANMLRLMEETFDDNDNDRVGLDNFSSEKYRQELEAAMTNTKRLKELPKGIFSGINKDKDNLTDNGIIALLGFPKRKTNFRNYEYTHYELIYVNKKGKPVFLNSNSILNTLSKMNLNIEGVVPDEIKYGDATTIESWKNAIHHWIISQSSLGEKDDENSTPSKAESLLKSLSTDLKAIDDVKKGNTPDTIYKPENFDLICWLYINE